MIWTETGEVPVEDLKIGDLVMTLSAETKAIKWIGRRSYDGRFIHGNRDVLPICIKMGALADQIPARDLWVSPEHGLYLDETLVPARHLVNGVSIIQVEDVETVEYFHIELDAHDVIIAEGAFAESFIDDDSRMMFNNAPEFFALYPSAPRLPVRYCAPRLEDGHELEELRRRLLGRARRLADDGDTAPTRLEGSLDRVSHDTIEGWAFDPAAPHVPVTVVILDNGAEIGRVIADRYRDDLEAAGIGDGCHAFSCAVLGGLAANAPHEIAVVTEVEWMPLSRSPVSLAPFAAPIEARQNGASEAVVLGALRGNLDTANRTRVTGWAQDETVSGLLG